jgi:DNA-binding winged helix-turn-helix (wHTH) protein/tetratricopeptide (TPR) repeat protein
MGNFAASSQQRFRFGLFEVDLTSGELRKHGLKVKVPRQSFRILAMLLERPGQVVTREELKRELWPDHVFVDFERGLNVAVQKLRSALQDTAQQARYIETLPKVGYRFVEAVIAVSEPRQPTPANGIVASAAEADQELASPVSLSGGRWKYLAAAGLVAVLLTAYVWERYRDHRPKAEARAPQPALVIPSSRRPSIAVMGFKNVSGNPQSSWLSTAFSEMLATEMDAGNRLRSVPEEDVAHARLELSLPEKDSYSSSTLTKIHADLGCDYVVVGSYLALGRAEKGQVRLDARVQNTVTGETVASVAVAGNQSELFDMASRAGEQLRAKLDIEALSSPESEAVRASLPANPQAARFYSEGLAKLRVFDNLAARDLLEKVIASEPRFAPAYLALSMAWSALGYDGKALAAAEQAKDLSGSLPERLRLEAEARFHQMSREWPQAADVYLRLQRSHPDDLDYGLDLARTQYLMGKSAEAVATLSALRKLPLPERDDPRIDLVEAATAAELGDFQREQTLAESAVRKAERAGARLLLARARQVEGHAFDNHGDFSRAIETYAAAQRTFAEAGDLDRSAEILMDTGIVLFKQGNPAGAKKKMEQAQDIFRRQGDQANLASALANLGSIDRGAQLGSIKEVEHLHREALSIFTEIGLKGRQAGMTNNLAALLEEEGKFQEAKDLLVPLVEQLRNSQNKLPLADALQNLGSVAESQGDMETATDYYGEAVALFKDMGERTDYGEGERVLGRAYLRRGDFEKANRALSEALSVDRNISAKAEVALDQVALTEIALEQGKTVDFSTLRASIEELRGEKMTSGEITAEIMLVRALLHEGKTAEAAVILKDATALSSKSYDPVVHFDIALTTARLRAARRRFAEASHALQPALEQATQLGCVSCQLEARLDLGEIEMAKGKLDLGRSQLRDLAAEAQRRGFGLVARRAAETAK